MSSNGYLYTQAYGPLSHQYPFAMPPHSSGNLIGLRPNPPSFYPSDNTGEYANSRYNYYRTIPSTKPTAHDFDIQTKKKKICGNNSSSLNTDYLKKVAIGKSSYKIGLPNTADLTYRSYNKNDVKQALQKVRSSGSVAPKKKGAIQNHFLKNSGICCLSASPGIGAVLN
jgi:hypothetical protein